jgi:branched-chain amino acid transport system ATP-binding protein
LTDEERQRLAEILREVVRQHGHTVMVVEHDLDWTLKLVDRLTVFDRGKVIADGEPRAVSQSSIVRAAYLGENPKSLEVGS